MKPKVIVDVSIVLETAIKLDPDKPAEMDEQVKILVDLLTDLKCLLESRA